MQHRDFHQPIWFRATGACLLAAAVGVAGWLDGRGASALPINVIPIRPLPPTFKVVRVLPEPGIPPLAPLSPIISPGLSALKPAPAIRLRDIGLNPSGRKLLTGTEAFGVKAVEPSSKIDLSSFRFVENESRPSAGASRRLNPEVARWDENGLRPEIRIPRLPISPRSAVLDGYYAPAADLAPYRTSSASFRAERAVGQYEAIVRPSRVVNEASAHRPTERSEHDARQLANRLILAVLEDTDPDPPGFAPPPASVPEVQQKLVDGLNKSGQLSGRPVGDSIWGDTLRAEFPLDAHQWRAQALPSSEDGILNFRVDSFWLPSTVTPIDVGSYAISAVQSQVAVRRLIDGLSRARTGSFNQPNIK